MKTFQNKDNYDILFKGTFARAVPFLYKFHLFKIVYYANKTLLILWRGNIYE